jgi:hypothetical protein
VDSTQPDAPPTRRSQRATEWSGVVGVRADRGGEVSQVHGGQQRVAEAGAEREQPGGGPHGRLVVQGGEAYLT